MDTFLNVVIQGLAGWMIIEIWRHGSIFASWRADVESWGDSWLKDLLECAFCLSVWVAVILSVLWYVPIVGIVLHAFAVARLISLGYRWMLHHYPPADQLSNTVDPSIPLIPLSPDRSGLNWKKEQEAMVTEQKLQAYLKQQLERELASTKTTDDQRLMDQEGDRW